MQGAARRRGLGGTPGVTLAQSLAFYVACWFLCVNRCDDPYSFLPDPEGVEGWLLHLLSCVTLGRQLNLSVPVFDTKTGIIIVLNSVIMRKTCATSMHAEL